ncbi:MAG TPA: UDP-N-acetylmuramate dehydrogenase [Devosia sp.]|nr:UDP-N-acetylmuramate dehydrogenase [Devosia sp.]
MSFSDLRPLFSGWIEGVRGRLAPNQNLSEVTWFRVGGPAQLLFMPEDEADLSFFLSHLPPEVKVTIVGLGSNLLVRDGGLEGVVIRLPVKGFADIELLDEHRVRVGAAMPDIRFAQAMAKAGIDGFTFYRGIPGGIGGALYMNAGCYGTETADRLVELRGVTREGKIITLSRAEMAYEYRKSHGPEGVIFTSALYQGFAGDPDELNARMEEITKTRESSQPTKSRTGGSTFKNPEGTSSWELIDRAGCRGLTIGKAQVSQKHCNFLLNLGDASALEIETLGETVRQRVRDNSGVELQWEIRRMGRFIPGEEIGEFLGDKVFAGED